MLSLEKRGALEECDSFFHYWIYHVDHVEKGFRIYAVLFQREAGSCKETYVFQHLYLNSYQNNF